MNWAEVGQAFDELLQTDESERHSYLDLVRNRDRELADELSTLLRAHEQADGFFEDKVPRLFGSLAPQLNLAKGTRLLHFEIMDLLGEGSLAKVYLARDTDLERLVALKITFDENKEARTLAQFNLDGIVQVHSEHWVNHEGLPLRLLCLQFIAGPTLAQLTHRLVTQPTQETSFVKIVEVFSPRQVAFEPASVKWREHLATLKLAEALICVGTRIAEILSHAHSRGVLHLDIKPANILVDVYGRPFVSDFNVSTYTERLARGDVQGLGGTPHYMSPEQTRFFETRTAEDAARIDARSDVYALGIVLQDLLRSIAFRDAALDVVLSRATAADREQRTPSATELACELNAWLRSSLTEAEMPPPMRGFQWMLKKPMAAVVALTLLSQVFSSVINISYNRLQIVTTLSAEQSLVFFKCVSLYNMIFYPLPLCGAFFALRELFKSNPDREKARRTTLRLPLIVGLTISAGWLPGAWLFPKLIDLHAGPLPLDVYWQFAFSFSIGWLISMTTSLALNLFVIARSLYPKFWQGRSALATSELRTCERVNRSLTFASALVPMAGVLWMLLMTPLEHSPSSYRSFKILLIVTIGFGLINLMLVSRLTRNSEIAFSALKRPRSFD